MKYLKIENSSDDRFNVLGLLIGLLNLKQLWLEGKNLKSLKILNGYTIDPYNFLKITVENIQKLEKLSITYIWRTKGIWHLVQKCRKLLELIFAHFAAEANMYITPTVINEILAQ